MTSTSVGGSVDDLAVARAAELAVVRRAVTEAREIEGGWILRHPALPDVWDLNRVHLTGDAPRSADELGAIAEAGLAGLSHRRVVLDDADGGERLTAGLISRGWETRRRLFMAFRGRPESVEGDPRARILADDDLVAVQRRVFGELAGDRPAQANLLTAAAAALRAGTEARGFGAGDTDTELTSTATLFLHRDVGGRRIAVIHAVATLRAARERGLGRAVTRAAVRLAGDWGAELITLAADAEDWPQLMYHEIGFRALGRQLTADRRPPVT